MFVIGPIMIITLKQQSYWYCWRDRISLNEILIFPSNCCFIKFKVFLNYNYLKQQTLQSKILRKLSHFPFYAPNKIILRDLNAPLVLDSATISWQTDHPNLLVQFLFSQNIPYKFYQTSRAWMTERSSPHQPVTLYRAETA